MTRYRYRFIVVSLLVLWLGADAFVTFALNPDGSVDQARMRAVSPATDFSFDFQDLLLKPAARRE